LIEDRIEIMQRVSDLIYRMLFRLAQTAVRKKRVLFEKETNLVS